MDSYVNIPDYPNYSINRGGTVITHYRCITYKNGVNREYEPKLVSFSRSYMGDKKYFLRKNNKSHFVFASDLIKSAFSINEIVTQSENEND